MTATPSRPVLIVGGGIAGLSAAFELHRSGVPFLLLEAAPRLGGVVLTERSGDLLFDAGPDSILVHKPAGIELCRELGLEHRLVPTRPPRVAFVLREGVFHRIPSESVLGIPRRREDILNYSLLSPEGRRRMVTEPEQPIRQLGEEDDESIGAFFTRRFGGEACDSIAEPLLAGIHAGDVWRLSMRALFPQLLDAERRTGSVLKALERWPRAGASGLFRSFPNGIQELTDALHAALPPESIVVNCPVRAVEREREWGVRLPDGRRVDAPAVILAVPAFVASRAIASADRELARLLAEISYVSTVTAFLAYPRERVRHPLDGSGFVVPRTERAVRIRAASWLSSKWPGRAPVDVALIRTFLGGRRDPEAIDSSDDDIVATAQRDLERLLDIAGRATFARVYRWPNAWPQHDIGHLSRLRAIETRLRALPGLFLTGSAYRATGIPDCIGDARATARLAAGRSGDARLAVPDR